MGQRETTQRDHDLYWSAVRDVAENVVTELEDAEPDDDQNALMSRLVSEKCDQHDCVIHDELNILTLLHAKNACAGFFDGTFSGKGYARDDNFPFSSLAADAFGADVTEKVQQLMGDS